MRVLLRLENRREQKEDSFSWLSLDLFPFLCACLFLGAVQGDCESIADNARTSNALDEFREFYQKRATWHETMLASRQAFEAYGKQLQERLAASPPLRGGERAYFLETDITGWRELYLIVEDEGDYHHDVANWGDAKLIDAAGAVVFLDSLDPVSVQQAWGVLHRDGKSAVGGPLQITGQTFTRGLGTHGRSVIHYRLANDFVSFEAEVGIDVSRGTEGEVRFLVLDRPPRSLTAFQTRLWQQLSRDFSDETARQQMRWERKDQIWEGDRIDLATLAQRYAKLVSASDQAKAAALALKPQDEFSFGELRALYCRDRGVAEARAELEQFNFESLRLAIGDLSENFETAYPAGARLLAALAALEAEWTNLQATSVETERVISLAEELHVLRGQALRANPLLDFERILLVRRNPASLGLPSNWQGNSSLPRTGFDNDIAILSLREKDAEPHSLFRPANGAFVGDLELHFDADRLIFSSLDSNQRWQIFEVQLDGAGLRQVTPGDQPDVDNYDACYLPDGRVIFCSTASFVGVPCVDGSDFVGTLFQLGADGRAIRQLCFDQDHNWSPTLLNDGRVLYQRWEYADTPHAHTRLLFRMNPDGTTQEEFYGSNSYWPNALFYARPIPNEATKVVAIVSGHHGVNRIGELVLFDTAKGRQETAGVVQRIPGFKRKVEPIIRDQLVDASWPKFLHPWPLSDKYFLVSAQMGPGAPWGIYLVDVFDNMLLLAESGEYALLEPIPLRPRTPPPIIPDRIDLTRKDAVVYLGDIYQGDGLKGVPRGTVKRLRVFSYHWAYRNMGGLLGTIGLDGPWDIRRILGTVPVEADGSAFFRVPANTPIAVQPLDAEGKALQVMRSWFTAMPGESVSCVGCHDKQNRAPTAGAAMALQGRAPLNIEPWHGPARGFSFKREVQPVLDRHCLSCHYGDASEGGSASPDLRGNEYITDFRLITPGRGERLGGRFNVAYANLHRYVRRPGIESDYHLLMPLEFHADTTELVQLLKNNHYAVQLDPESWDRLITWIDLNAPYHGSWGEELQDPGGQRERRRELRKLYAGMDDSDAEAIPVVDAPKAAAASAPCSEIIEKVIPKTTRNDSSTAAEHWPFDAAEARRRSRLAGTAQGSEWTFPLDDKIQLSLTLIPPGEFMMGDTTSGPQSKLRRRVRITKPFWMSRTEIRNDQYAQFDPGHDSHVESKTAYQFGVHGYPVNEPAQPVVRVSWEQAMRFCEWISAKTGRGFTLPTEEQWEYACRAGTETPFYFGPLESDFSKYANLADAKLREFASDPYTVFTPLPDPSPYEDYIPKETRFHDGALVSAPVGSYASNAWGLFDMHGNVWEWTRSNGGASETPGTPGGEKKVVRGGSWRDRPYRATSSSRLAYAPWQGVFNVGFRVICEE